MLGLRTRLPRRLDDRADVYAEEPNGLVIRHAGPVYAAPHDTAVVPPSLIATPSRPAIRMDETFTLRPNSDIDTEMFTKGHQPIPHPVLGNDSRQLPWDSVRRITRGTPGQWDAAAVIDPATLQVAPRTGLR